jgi:hypothetical protein
MSLSISVWGVLEASFLHRDCYRWVQTTKEKKFIRLVESVEDETKNQLIQITKGEKVSEAVLKDLKSRQLLGQQYASISL